MLEEKEVKVLLATRILRAQRTTGSYLLAQLEGEIRALAFVLTGQTIDDASNHAEVLNLVNIPHDSGVMDASWLSQHGFSMRRPECPTHQKMQHV